MKKVRAHKLLYGAAGLMVLGFVIHTFVDLCRYNNVANSAPFRIWIALNAMYWLIPAALAFLAGFVADRQLRKKRRKKTQSHKKQSQKEKR